MKNPFTIIEEFEREVANYTGAPYCVAVNSCTNALFLCLMYMKYIEPDMVGYVNIPKLTYISVPMQIKHAGFQVRFRDEDWQGIYQLEPYYIFDSARRFRKLMYTTLTNIIPKTQVFMCTSHHWTKILGLGHGGCILHNDPWADEWLRRARHDGRLSGLSVAEDAIPMLGYHCPMSPEIAAQGLVRLAAMPAYNADLPRSDYPDLSKMEIFK